MTIPISFLTAVLKKTAIEATYPGGLAAFLLQYPGVPEDAHLIGVPFMSGGELQQFVDSLTALGFDVHQGMAIGEVFPRRMGAVPGHSIHGYTLKPLNPRVAGER